VVSRAQLPAMEFLQLMLISRESDRREGILIRQGKGWFQIPGIGHEPIGALAYHLQPSDYIFPHYRDRALMLARGLTPHEIARDFFTRTGSSSEGRNMQGHWSARHLNVFSIASPIGAQCLPAVGAAWGIKKAGTNQVVLCNIGDAAMRQGEFFEAVCFAVQENLPIVFVVEDNAYSISTPTHGMCPFRLGIFNDALARQVNGRDVLEVFDHGGQAIEQARAHRAPTILWCELDRLGSHTTADDHRVYRSAEEIQDMLQRDPIALLANRLMGAGALTVDDWQKMQDEATQMIDTIYQQVEREPPPDPAHVLDHLYGPHNTPVPFPFQIEEANTTMVALLNRTFHMALAQHPRLLMFGEDIADPKGGVFGLTKGLSTHFPGRVVNSPIAEATIVGTAVGLAAIGYRPVFELQFIDFITPGFHQLVSQIATLRWRSNGLWTCPLVLYAPYGAYLPGGGIWHSQSNDGLWAHTPGIKVAIPSTPEDAAGLFWTAFEADDPSLILLPKHLFRVRMPVRQCQPVPFGKAIVRREGHDVTVVSWGNCLELAEQAAQQLKRDGVSLEIIDLRTLVPCDWQTLEASLAKTGRLVVIHEDNRTCGFGEAVITEMVSNPKRFNFFLSPPQLVARHDVHVPFTPELEFAILPNLERVLRAIYTTLE
jgi:2-oxoisovalerate dehydrogenase E1 component